MPEDTRTYDVAVSFSGRQRAYVEQVVRACEALNVRVFYDLDETVRLWGKNVIPELRRVYGGVLARYVVPFLSQDYLAGGYPMDEFFTAMTAGVERGDGYLLPVLMDDVEIPPELLNPAVIYLRSADYTPEALARAIADKVAAGRAEQHEPREVTSVVEETLQLRMPRIPPVTFDRHRELATTMARVGQLFETASGKLLEFRLTCRVQTTESSVQVVVEDQNTAVCELALLWGLDGATECLEVRLGSWPPAVHAVVTVRWDPDHRRPALELRDSGGVERPKDADELFALLWDKVVAFIDNSVA